MAERVMRMAAPGPLSAAPAAGLLQRACADCEEELFRMPAGSQAGRPAANLDTLRSGGQPLPGAARAFFEPRFGRDFSRVRVHTGAQADQAARSVNALAFTMGQNIVFRAAHFAPHTPQGKKLLAHELAHVVQQGAGAPHTRIQRQPPGPGEEEKKESASPPQATATIGEIETNWKVLRGDGSQSSTLSSWITHGDKVVALMKQHGTTLLQAQKSGDRELFVAMRAALDADTAMYEFISWHTAVYINLLSVKGDMARLVDSFDADKREFTGRGEAERLTREIHKATQGVDKHSADNLGFVRTDIAGVVRKGAANEVNFEVTSASIPKVQAILIQRTQDIQALNVNLELGTAKINAFLSTARAEGFVQAIDAVRQFYDLKRQLGRGPKASKSKKPAAADKKPGKQEQKPTKQEQKPAQEKKAQEKKPEEKKFEEKKPEEKKAQEKKPEEKKPEEKQRKTCATQYPTDINCSRLPFEYKFPSHQAALAALKIAHGDSNMRIEKPAVATSGPCPGRGMHYNVRSGKSYVASIGCCPCCRDLPSGPVRLTLCRII